MQFVSIDGALVIVLLEGLAAFIVMVTYLLLRHTNRKQFKYWAIGWIVYIVGVTTSLFDSTHVLGLSDGFELGALLVCTLIFFDGTNLNFRKGKSNLIYPILGLAGISLCAALSPFGIHFSVIFAPLSIPLFFILIMTALELYESVETSPIMIRIAVIGISFWAVSLLLAAFTLFEIVLYIQVILQTSALLVTGCGLLGLFTEITQRDLNEQYIASETLSGIVQHDIRNYIQIALSALEMSKISELPDEMVDLALQSLQDAYTFVNEMRTITATLSYRDSKLKTIYIYEIFVDIRRRVSREYDFGDDRILVIIPSDTIVQSVKPIKEVIWNIVDNAFKHGSSKLLVKIRDFSDSKVTLSITDNAGGIESHVKRFINDGGISIGKSVSGVGLGLTLINRLAPVCGIKIQVEDSYDDSEVIGTIFSLTFDKPPSSVTTQF